MFDQFRSFVESPAGPGDWRKLPTPVWPITVSRAPYPEGKTGLAAMAVPGRMKGMGQPWRVVEAGPGR